MPGDNWGETGVSLLPIRKAPCFETILTHIGAFSNCLHLRWQTLYSLLQATRGGVEKTMKWLIFLFCMLGFGCNWAGDPQHLPAETIDVNGLSRTYHIFVPANPPEGSMPLLIAAHGGGGAGEVFPQQGEFEALAEAEGIIIALPQGKVFAGNEGEWLLNTTPERMEDINFINALIADVSTNHSVDANRIYGIGYSLGSMFSYEFACQMSNQFAAIASFAGTMPVNPTACDPQRFAPIMHIHGTDDSIIAYGNEWGWKSWPQVGDMRDIPSLLSYWRDKYQCADEQENTGANTHFVYGGCAQNARVEHYRIGGAGRG